MSVRLIPLLSRFRNVDDRESETALFLTHVPWVASQAYLNIVFKPAAIDTVRRVARSLELPHTFRNFLESQNGAILFSGALSIYGVHCPGQLLNRSDPFSRLPFDIELENSNHPPDDPTRLFAIGGYGMDGSRVCMDRYNLKVEVWPRDTSRLGPNPSFSWSSLNEWIASEVARLSMLFSESGKLLAAESETLPHRVRSH